MLLFMVERLGLVVSLEAPVESRSSLVSVEHTPGWDVAVYLGRRLRIGIDLPFNWHWSSGVTNNEQVNINPDTGDPRT